MPYLPLPREDNPALGLRGVRTSLAHPHLLRAQLAAIVRASARSPCRILVPMVNEVDELATVRAMAHECARAQDVAMPPLGVMVETPAAALSVRSLARHCEFLSIGSNDLSQYALAIDRGHADLARRLDALHPVVLRLIAVAADAAANPARAVGVRRTGLTSTRSHSRRPRHPRSGDSGDDPASGERPGGSTRPSAARSQRARAGVGRRRAPSPPGAPP
jgi:phosphoenolpyruvate-protein kinase (PTS system EI component)